MIHAKCHPDRRNFAFGMCRPCYGHAYYMKNHDRDSECSSQRYYQNREKILISNKNRRLLRMYGMSLEEYQKLCADQKGLCAICSEKPIWLCVDHNHKTGQVRGLLCPHCNALLYRFDETPGYFEKVVAYLSNPPMIFGREEEE